MHICLCMYVYVYVGTPISSTEDFHSRENKHEHMITTFYLKIASNKCFNIKCFLKYF